MTSLTERQEEVYDFIKKLIYERGYGPTVREIGAEFNIKSPNGVACHLKALEKKKLIRRTPNRSRAIELVEGPPTHRAELPLRGVVAAGSPLLADDQVERVEFQDLFDDPNHFVLQVKGESMIDDQIADGDYVIVKRQRTAQNGEIVVALIEGHEATLKRFHRESKRIRLEPANATMGPIFATEVEILGKVVGVVRKY